MKILNRKTIDSICEREIDNMLIMADTFMFHEMPATNYRYMIDSSMSIISSVGGQKWVVKAQQVFNEKVAEAKKEVELKNKNSE